MSRAFKILVITALILRCELGSQTACIDYNKGLK